MLEAIKRKIVKWLLGEFALTAFDNYSDVWNANQEFDAQIKDLLRQIKAKELELDSYRSNRLLKLVMGIKILDHSQNPIELLNEGARRDYVSRIANMKAELFAIIDWLTASQIEALARTMFDPNRFNNLNDQHMFNAGNINLADLIKEQIEEIAAEHYGNVESAKQGKPAESSDNPMDTMEEMPAPPEAVDSDFDLFGVVNSIKTR